MNYRHVFFDLDRTLWDFDQNSRMALSQLIDELELHNHGIDDKEVFIQTYQKINEECWAKYRKGLMEKAELRHRRFGLAMERFGIDDPMLAKRFGDGYIDISPKMTLLVEGTNELLNYLNGKYELHIITNGFKEVQHIKLNNSGIAHHFDKVIISEEVGEKKPHPAVFDFALRATSSKAKEALMIGDDLEADVVGARNAGWDQVYFNPGKFEHNEEVRHEIEHLTELMKIL